MIKMIINIASIVIIILSSVVLLNSLFTKYKNTESISVVKDIRTDVDNYYDEDKLIDNSLYEQAVLLHKAKRYSEAVKILKLNLSKYQQHAQSYYLLGKIFEDNELPDHAGKLLTEMKYCYHKYLDIKPNGMRKDYVKLKLAQYYIRSSLITSNNKDIDMASKLLEGLDMSDNDVKMALGTIYLSRKEYDKAVKEFENAINIQADEVSTKYNSLGLAYIRLNKIKEAKNALEIAVAIEPKDPFAHNNLGYIYMRLGMFNRAKDEFKTAVRINPKYKNAVKNYHWMNTDKEMQKKLQIEKFNNTRL